MNDDIRMKNLLLFRKTIHFFNFFMILLVIAASSPTIYGSIRQCRLFTKESCPHLNFSLLSFISQVLIFRFSLI